MNRSVFAPGFSLIVIMALAGCSQVSTSETIVDSPSPTPSVSQPQQVKEPAWKKYLELEMLELSISTTDCNPGGSIDYVLRMTNLTNKKMDVIRGGVVALRSEFGMPLLGVIIDHLPDLDAGETVLVRPDDCLEFRKALNPDAFEDLEKNLDYEYRVGSILFRDGQNLNFEMFENPLFVP
jgi:hypothetical protein